MIKKLFLTLTLLLTVWMLATASVRKKDDPILRTQTNPIALKEKMEEIKDGEKGAPSPSFKHYPKSQFLTEPPMEGQPDSEPEAPGKSAAEWDESLIEDLGEDEDTEESEEEDWWEEGWTESDENEFKETAEKDVAEDTRVAEEKVAAAKGAPSAGSKS